MSKRFVEKVRALPAIKTLADIKAIEQTPLDEYELPDSTLELIRNSAAQYPDRTALRFLMTGEAGEDGFAYSYREFLYKILQTANGFESLGIGSRDVVSFLLPSLPQTHFTLWGAEAAGIVNPINPLLEPEHIAGIMNGAGTRVLVTAAPFPGLEMWDKVEQLRAQIPTLEKVLYVDLCQFLPAEQAQQIRAQMPLPQHDWCEDFDAFIARFPGDRQLSGRVIHKDDTASLFHTGGTTGTPKLAPHSHFNEVVNGAMPQFVLRHDEHSVLMCGLPLFHVNAVVMTGLLPLLNGSEILLATPAGYRNQALMQNFWKVVERHKVSFFSAVPAIYAGLLQLPVGNANISSLQNVLSGGAPLPVAVHQAFEKLTRIPLIEGFGMTEGTCGSTTNPAAGERRTGSIGLPLPFSDVRVVELGTDGELVRDCDVDETGNLLIRGPNVFKGYTDPSKNTDIWYDGDWFNTGDLARRDAEGYVWLTGRAKDLIIRGGHNIDPQMIEDVLHRHPAVAMAAAVGKPCDRVGELPVAYVSLRPGVAASPQELIDFCAEHIAERAAVPKDLWIIDAIPLTAVGKVFKPTLRRDAIRRVIEERLGTALAAEDFRVEVSNCKQHGQRADVFIQHKYAARQAELAAELANYAFYSELHIAQ